MQCEFHCLDVGHFKEIMLFMSDRKFQFNYVSSSDQFLESSLKFMNKYNSSNVNRRFIQSYLVFNAVLKILAQKHYLYIVHETFLSKMFSWTFV